MVHFGKDLLTNQVPGWEEYVFFLRFFFVSFSGESGNHSTREFFVRCRKTWKSQGWRPTAFPNLNYLVLD
jgi:hypothetical protein